jgi:endonuclease-8
VPEGDTVWNTARGLHRALAGQRIERGDFRVPRLAAADVAGWTVEESVSRGKHLLMRLANPAGEPYTLHSHLRMDGAWRVFAPGERWRGRPAHLIRVALHTAPAVAVGYHLHELALVPTGEEKTLVGHLGPDLLGTDWDPAEAVRRLRERPDRPIADALLDQRNLAGIGNLYKAETLFLRGVSPWTPVSDVDNLEALVALAQRLLASNRGRWAQVTTGSLRRGEEQWVFRRAGSPCRRCGTTIRRATEGDHDRITYWCPTCQPGPAPEGRTRPTLARD